MWSDMTKKLLSLLLTVVSIFSIATFSPSSAGAAPSYQLLAFSGFDISDKELGNTGGFGISVAGKYHYPLLEKDVNLSNREIVFSTWTVSGEPTKISFKPNDSDIEIKLKQTTFPKKIGVYKNFVTVTKISSGKRLVQKRFIMKLMFITVKMVK